MQFPPPCCSFVYFDDDISDSEESLSDAEGGVAEGDRAAEAGSGVSKEEIEWGRLCEE